MRPPTRYLTAIGAAALLFSATACANSGSSSGGALGGAAASPAPTSAAAAPTSAAASPAPDASADNAQQTVVTATFAQDDAADNYDKALVPDGAKALVAEYVFDGTTTVTLSVRGLVPNRGYGAHAHAKACGPIGDDAGPHFQHMADPVKPSVDPAFANPTNEIWLDFTTDAKGNAAVARTVPWVFTDAKAASVVIHAQPTMTGPGKAGTAGARAACVSVAF